jgi:flagellar biosynthesis GTPase FlhF
MSNTKDLLNKLQSTHAKMDQGKWSIDELETMVELSRELHERSVILRYKAFEQKVFEQKIESTESIESKIETVEASESIPDEPIDFGIFEKPSAVKVTAEPSFSFDMLKEREEVEEEEEEEKEVEVEREVEREVEVEDKEEEEEREVEVEREVEAEDKEEEEKEEEVEREVEVEGGEEEYLVETEEEVGIGRDLVESSLFDVGNWKSVITDIIHSNESSFRSELASLSGSFGMNERLLYINELFDGNADHFSDFIKKIDLKTSWEESQVVLELVAINENWTPNSETVHEFIIHVHRKYV